MAEPFGVSGQGHQCHAGPKCRQLSGQRLPPATVGRIAQCLCAT